MHREVTMKLNSELQYMTADCTKLDHQHSMAFQKISNPNEAKTLTDRQLTNSTELPGHSHGATMMSRVYHRMSDITRNPIANVDNVRTSMYHRRLKKIMTCT